MNLKTDPAHEGNRKEISHEFWRKGDMVRLPGGQVRPLYRDQKSRNDRDDYLVVHPDSQSAGYGESSPCEVHHPMPGQLIDTLDAVLWVPKTRSTLTGPVLAGYIGRSREEAASTCRRSRCPLAPSGIRNVQSSPINNGSGPAACYAWSGHILTGHKHLVESFEMGSNRSLSVALALKHRKARFAKLGALGDPGALSRRVVESIDVAVREAGLGLISYAYDAHRVSQHLKGLVNASTVSLSQADEAVDAGWATTTVLPPRTYQPVRTPAGSQVLPCPALLPDRSDVCNTCGRCDPRSGRDFIVGFPEIRRGKVGGRG